MRLRLAALLWGALLLSAGAQTPFRLMAYNVENLFDTCPDSLADDRDFLPEAPRRWTASRYWRKLDGVARVVAAVGEGRLPELVVLCEVENDSVLHDLTRRSSLRTAGYRYVMTASADRRGMDVALLYQPGQFRLLESRSLRVPSVQNGFPSTRDILYVSGKVLSGDTLHIFVCHLPSRAGATRQADRHRALAAATLQAAVDSLCAVCPDARILVAGDFNAAPGDPVFTKALRTLSASTYGGAGAAKPTSPVLYLTAPASRRRRNAPCGSYRYRGEWSFLDHVLVSGALMDSLSAFACRHPVELRAADYPFLLEPDRTHGGFHPLRTYQGPVYRGGISDHLPVWLDFVWRRR